MFDYSLDHQLRNTWFGQKNTVVIFKLKKFDKNAYSVKRLGQAGSTLSCKGRRSCMTRARAFPELPENS